MRLGITHVAAALLLCWPLAQASFANSPLFAGTYPDGGQRGTEVLIGLHGQRLTGLQEVVFHEPGIEVVKLEPVNDNLVNATLRITTDCRLGRHILRLRTTKGWTGLHTFYVGPYPTEAEKDPNDDFNAPQPIPFNVTVAGIAKSEDVDYYVIEAKKGQRISAEVEGIRLGITLFDPYVAILDTNRFELAASDDTPLTKQDPFVSIIAPEDGKYIIMVRESAYGGNDACRYRLHVGDFPRPLITYPLGVQADHPTPVKFLGDPTGDFEMNFTVPSGKGPETGLIAEKDGAVSVSPNWVRVSAMPNALESEPNNQIKQVTSPAVDAPVAFNGILEGDDDYDYFAFNAKAGQTLVFTAYARTLGSPADTVINIFKADGTHLGGNDDFQGKPDSAHTQQFPEDGIYYLRVRDHLQKGGPLYVYRVEVAPPSADMTITMPDVARYDDQNRQFVSVPRGNRWLVLMQANRVNFGGPVKLACDDLPAGVVMHAPVMPGNVSQIPVVFEAAADAPVTGKLCDLRAEHAENPAINGRWQQAVAFVRGDPNGTPYFSDTVHRLSVAVTDEAPFSVRIEQPVVPLLQSGVLNLRVVAEKKEGFDEPITVQLPFRPPGLGANPQVVIPKGQSEVYYQLNAAGNAAVGDWPLAVQAFSNVAGGQLWVASPLASLKIAPPLVTGEIALTVTEQGQTADVIVKLNTATPFDGEATLELIGLPAKCATQNIKIKSGQEQAVFKVTTEKESPLGQHKSLFCQVVLAQNGGEMRQSLAGGGTIRIDKPKEPVAAAPMPVQPMPQAAAPAAAPEAPKKVLSRLEQLREEQAKRNSP